MFDSQAGSQGLYFLSGCAGVQLATRGCRVTAVMSGCAGVQLATTAATRGCRVTVVMSSCEVMTTIQWFNILYSLDITPPFLPIRFSYKYGRLVYTPPFLVVQRARETAMAELSVTVLCGL